MPLFCGTMNVCADIIPNLTVLHWKPFSAALRFLPMGAEYIFLLNYSFSGWKDLKMFLLRKPLVAMVFSPFALHIQNEDLLDCLTTLKSDGIRHAFIHYAF